MHCCGHRHAVAHYPLPWSVPLASIKAMLTVKSGRAVRPKRRDYGGCLCRAGRPELVSTTASAGTGRPPKRRPWRPLEREIIAIPSAFSSFIRSSLVCHSGHRRRELHCRQSLDSEPRCCAIFMARPGTNWSGAGQFSAGQEGGWS